MEHFLLRDFVAVRDDDDVVPFDEERPPHRVLGGVVAKAMAQFRVGDRRCLAGVADWADAYPVGSGAGPGTDLREQVPAHVSLADTTFAMWQLPEWHIAGRTVLHLIFVAEGEMRNKRDSHRFMLGALQVERGAVPVLPTSMSTFGGDGLVQCIAEFRGRLRGLTVSFDQAALRAWSVRK